MLKNILILLSGSVIARALSILTVPIFTRFYSPAEFGLFSVFMGIASILIVISTLRYHVAIPLVKSDCSAINLVFLSVICVFFWVLFSGSLFFLAGEKISKYFPQMEGVVQYAWLLIIAVFAGGVYEIFNMWALRVKAMSKIACSQVIQVVVAVLVKSVGCFINPVAFFLVLGQISLQLSGLGVLTVSGFYNRRWLFRLRQFNARRLIVLAGKFIGFPFYRLPAQFLLVGAAQAPVFFLASMYGPSTAGQYALANTMLALPVSLLTQSVGSSYYSEIAALGIDKVKKIRDLTNSLLIKLIIVSLFPSAVLVVYSKDIFLLIFGEEWALAGKISQFLAVYIFFQLVSAPLVHVLTLFEKHRVFLILNIFRLLIVVFSFWFANYMNLKALRAVEVYAYGMVFLYVVICIYVLTFLKKGRKVNA